MAYLCLEVLFHQHVQFSGISVCFRPWLMSIWKVCCHWTPSLTISFPCVPLLIKDACGSRNSRRCFDKNLRVSPMLWRRRQALTKTPPPHHRHGISRQGQLQQVNSSQIPILSPPAIRTPCSPPHLQGAAPASRTPPTLQLPQIQLPWLQALVRPTPHHSSHHTQDPVPLFPLQGATLVPGLLLGP